MRISIVHSFYSSDQPSGENAVVNDQAAALSDAGHDIQLVARHSDHYDGLKYKAKSALTTATGLGPSPIAEFSRFKPDVIHVHNLFPNWGSRWIGQCEFPVVTTLHNFRPLCAAATLWLDGKPCRRCLDSGSQHAVLNHCYRDSTVASIPLAIASRRHARASHFIAKSRDVIVLNPLALEIYAEHFPTANVNLVPNFGPSVNALSGTRTDSIVYAGRLTPEKGVLELIRNWPARRRLEIFGTGPLQEQVQEGAHNSTNVVFRGQAPRETVRAEIAKATAVVVPSLWTEGIPTVALEAMAYGTPILISERIAASDMLVGDCPELITNFQSKSEVERNIAQVAENFEYYSSQSLRNARTTFDRGVWIEKMERIYSDTADRGSSRR